MKNLIRVSERDEYKWTTNRRVYNRQRKLRLELEGEIHCGYCPYNRVENWTGRHYGGYGKDGEDVKVNHPSWKLISKNKKQYQQKPVVKRTERSRCGWTYVSFRWNSKRYVK